MPQLMLPESPRSYRFAEEDLRLRGRGCVRRHAFLLQVVWTPGAGVVPREFVV